MGGGGGRGVVEAKVRVGEGREDQMGELERAGFVLGGLFVACLLA